MSNILKFKLGISTLSLTILVLIPLFRGNFNANVSFIRWRQLQWTDFKGFVKPFTGWYAGITSNMFLEYDSATNSYTSYAAMSDQGSWTKAEPDKSVYELTHEQYHFNISELHARMMNAYTADNTGKSKEEYLEKFRVLRQALDHMQDDYDDETDHSLKQDIQKRWEYKIDSMLLVYSEDSVGVTDYYSGARAFLPASPEFFHGLDSNQYCYRTFSLTKYDLEFTVSSFQHLIGFPNVTRNDLMEYYAEDSLEVVTIEMDSSQLFNSFLVEAYDSTANRYYHYLWKQNEGYRYKLTVGYEQREKGTEGYRQMAESFLNSFEISNTNHYWEALFDQSEDPLIDSSPAVPFDKNDPSDTGCIVYAHGNQHGFYRGPFYSSDGRLFLVYDVIEHGNSEIKEDILIANEQIYSFRAAEKQDHLFYIPARDLPSGSFDLIFGYLLAKDSVETCYAFYYDGLRIEPPSSVGLHELAAE